MKPLPNGFNVNETTLYTESDIKAGMTVELDSDGNAIVASENSHFIGVCTKAKGNYVTVALTGVVTVPYTGSAPSTGYDILAADGNGNVKFFGAGDSEYLVFNVDKEKHLATFML